MTDLSHKKSAFSLMELLLAMAVFAIAAVSLAQAINLISLTVAESIDSAEVREQLRAVLLETSRDPNLEANTRETNPNENGIYFRIEVTEPIVENREGISLTEIFEVRITALRRGAGPGVEVLDDASTLVYGGIF
ncbi:MAG: type II secretion system protein [Verrucomicrobiota bacterium]